MQRRRRLNYLFGILLTTTAFFICYQMKILISEITHQTSENKRDISKPTKPYQQIGSLPLYIYSAVAQFDKHQNSYPYISITAWDGTRLSLKCCFYQPNGVHTSIRAIELSSAGKAPLTAKQYACHLGNNKSLPEKVTLIRYNETCTHSKNYTDIFYPKNYDDKFGICTKVAYGTLEPMRLVEWFEYQQMLGVDRVISLVHNLDNKSRIVLEYYEKKGFAEIVPFGLPGMLRGFEENNRTFPQFTHDETIATYYCQDRLQRYGYVALIDFDEFIVPKQNLSMKGLVKDSLLNKWEAGAAFTFDVGFFIMNWGKSTPSSVLSTVQYTKRSKVGPECYKNIYIPDRVRPSSLRTHSVNPMDGHTKTTIPQSIAVLHHYRECPKVAHWKDCMTRPRYKDTSILKYQKQLEKRVIATWKYINNQKLIWE